MSRRLWPTGLALVAVLVASIATLGVATHGFAALTSDRARQLDLQASPRPLPAIPLVDSQGRVVDLKQRLADRQYTVVALVYTQCTSLCLLTTSSEAYLQHKLRAAGLEGNVGLLTISFDPARDTPDALAQYTRRVKAHSDQWTVSTVADVADLDELLASFGVVVLPEANGEFTHNGALFLVDRHGRLFDALPPDAADLALVRLRTLVSR